MIGDLPINQPSDNKVRNGRTYETLTKQPGRSVSKAGILTVVSLLQTLTFLGGVKCIKYRPSATSFGIAGSLEIVREAIIQTIPLFPYKSQ